MNANFVALLARLFGNWVHRVDASTLRADALAGMLGALLVLPQSFAFATLAGLPPEFGLYTAIVPCIVAALLGSSWQVVSGPTNANSLALFATLAPLAAVGSPQYIALAMAVTVLVGAIQLAIGSLRLGSVADFISPAALRGFTGGAAALIVLYALPDLLGIAAPTEHRLPSLAAEIGRQSEAISLLAVGIGMVALLLAVAVRRWRPTWPAMLIGLSAATALAYTLSRSGLGAVAVIGPLAPIHLHFALPDVEPGRIGELVGIAFALTIVALGQSIAIAKAIAARSGQHLDANREFRGQGWSNLVGGFFSSYVSCGSFNRSMPNLQAGARTPLAAVAAALWLFALVSVIAPLLAFIPMPAISGLLLLIGWNLFDVAGWRRLWQGSRVDFAVAAATFVATISIRIEMAILLGTLLSLVVYLHRTSRPAMRVMGFDSDEPARPFVVRAEAPSALPECPQLKMVRMEGEVYFAAVSHVDDELRQLRAAADAPKHLLVMAKSMNFVDVAGGELWQRELLARRANGGDLYFHRPRSPVLVLWQRTGFMAELGVDHVFPAKRIAIAAIFERLDRGLCAHCTVRVFEECKTLPEPVPPWLGAAPPSPPEG